MTDVVRSNPGKGPTQLPADHEDRMSHGFAVFNLHVNNAGERADAEFIAQFGQKRFDRHIAPLRASGIMEIFQTKPNQWRLIWVALVTGFVNEKRRPFYATYEIPEGIAV